MSEELRNILPVSETRTQKKKDIICLAYDLTPSNLIVMVITEFKMMPTTSVPVILREFRADQAVL